MPATYTHVGCLPHIGYRHRSNRLFGHTTHQSGKQHAMTFDGRAYATVCGMTIPVETDDATGERIKTPACRASGGKVTCRACLKLRPVAVAVSKHAEFAVRYEFNGETLTYARHSHQNEAVFMAGRIQERGLTFGERPDRVWVEEVQVEDYQPV